MMKISDKNKGIAFGLLSAAFVTGYLTTNKFIYQHNNISAIAYSQVFAFCGALYALFSLSTKLNKPLIYEVKTNFWQLVLLSVGGTLAVSLLVIGQNYTTAVNASLLVTLSIVGTIVFSRVLLNERPNKQQYIWTLGLFIGLYIAIVGFHTIHLRAGDLLIIASVMFFGFGNAYSRVTMKRISRPNIVPDVRLLIAGLIGLLVGGAVIRDYQTIMKIFPLALLAGLFYWLTMKTFARSVYLVNANNAVTLNQAQIFLTALAGVLLLSEHYNVEKLIGSFIVITSIYFIAHKNNSDKDANSHTQV